MAQEKSENVKLAEMQDVIEHLRKVGRNAANSEEEYLEFQELARCLDRSSSTVKLTLREAMVKCLQ